MLSTFRSGISSLYTNHVVKIFVEGEKYTKRMEDGTHKMIEVVLICEVYARRHVLGHVEDEFEDTTQSTHNLITDLLSQVLEFFHIMTKHFESKDGRRRSRIRKCSLQIDKETFRLNKILPSDIPQGLLQHKMSEASRHL